MRASGLGLIAAVLAGSPPAAGCEEAEAAFVLVEKGVDYRQGRDGRLELIEYHFVGELFGPPGGPIASTEFGRIDATGALIPLAATRPGASRYERKFDAESEMNAAYPDGRYRYAVRDPAGAITEHLLSLRGPDARSNIPAPITATFSQDGRIIPPDAIAPERPLAIAWSPFARGNADPRGIVDDLVFVIITDGAGKSIVHSGFPIAGRPFLTYRDEEYRVAGGALAPCTAYDVQLIHVDGVDTTRHGGVTGMATYNSRTMTRLATTAGAGLPPCPPP
jgi:hypothetical protein